MHAKRPQKLKLLRQLHGRRGGIGRPAHQGPRHDPLCERKHASDPTTGRLQLHLSEGRIV